MDTGSLASVTLIRLVLARTSICAPTAAVSFTWIRWRQVELQSARARATKVTPDNNSDELYRLDSLSIIATGNSNSVGKAVFFWFRSYWLKKLSFPKSCELSKIMASSFEYKATNLLKSVALQHVAKF